MKHRRLVLRTLVTMLLAALVLVTAGRPTLAEETTPAKAERTIMLYVCGSDLESYSGLASHNLRQVLGSAFSKDERVRFLVMTGGAEEWFLERDYLYDPRTQASPDGIDVGRNQIWEARGTDAPDNPGKLVLVDDGTQFESIWGYDEFAEQEKVVGYEGSMADPATLQYFVDYCAQNYPAEKYDLILWDHGGGPTDSFGLDFREESPTTMPLDGLVRAVAHNEVTKDGGRFDLIDFDACLMGSLEVTLALADYTDYYVCSPENVPGYGEEYSGWLGLLGQDPTIDTYSLGKRLVDDFLTYYNECEEIDTSTEATLALVDTQKLLESGFVDDLNELVGLLERAAREADASTGEILFYDELRSYRDALQYGGTYYRDLGNVLSQLAVTFYELTADDVVGDAGLDMASEYVDVAERLGRVLADESVVYAGASDTMSTSEGLFRSLDGSVDHGVLASSGLHIFFPAPKDDGEVRFSYAPALNDTIEVLQEDGRVTPESLAFLQGYRDVMHDYGLVCFAGRTVNAMINEAGIDRDAVNYESFKAYLSIPELEEMPDFHEWNNRIYELLRLPAGSEIPQETQAWIDRLVRQQAAETVAKEDISSADIVQQLGVGHRVRIQNTRRRQIQSVSAKFLAELPAAEAFFELDEYKDWLAYLTEDDGSLQIEIGSLTGQPDLIYGMLGGDLSLDGQGDHVDASANERVMPMASDGLPASRVSETDAAVASSGASVLAGQGEEGVASAVADAQALLAAGDGFLEDYVNGFNSSTTSVWDLDAFEGKWYAIRDAAGKLHVIDGNPNEDPLFLVTYHKEGSDEPEPLLLGFAENGEGTFVLRDLYFVNEESGLRPIPVRDFKGELAVTSAKIVRPFFDTVLYVPVSQTEFTVSAANAGDIQIVYEDVAAIDDIADTTGDGNSITWKYVVKDIYDGECDITALVEAAEDGTLYDIRLADVQRSVYNGRPQAPTLTRDGATLQADVDYAWSATYDDSLTDAGEHFVDLLGLGKYVGVVLAVPFHIDPASISEATVSGIEDKAYTGEAIGQAPVLAFAGATLVEGVDYDVAYQDNVEVGTASVIFTGKGNFTGTMTKTFQIVAAAAQDDEGKPANPEVAPDNAKPTDAPAVLPKTADPAAFSSAGTLAALGLATIAVAGPFRRRAVADRRRATRSERFR